MTEGVRYAIGDLADLGGVSRRTVRYYVQEGLLPPPLGVGRGNHYGTEHLERLLRVKALQEAGRTLEEIRAALAGAPAARNRAQTRDETPFVAREVWRRVVLAPGVELHLADRVPLPSDAALRDLAAWCHEFILHRDDPSR
jgi:DNA-binding transcriptional MerR regulator